VEKQWRDSGSSYHNSGAPRPPLFSLSEHELLLLLLQ
jgi:hypothetical protein